MIEITYRTTLPGGIPAVLARPVCDDTKEPRLVAQRIAGAWYRADGWTEIDDPRVVAALERVQETAL